jgi:hypothetical protein
VQVFERLNLAVSTATVAIMFAILEYLVPMLQASAIPAAFLKLIPFATPAQLVEASKFVLTVLATFGTYKLLASVLIRTIDRISYLKSFIFGPSYVEGTWIGQFGDNNQSKWSVEHFEQTLNGVIIRGYAHNRDGTAYASWISNAVSIDYVRGILTYTYDCDLIGHNSPQQGIGVFQFERPATGKAPTGIKGYSTDLVDGVRSANHEFKISNDLILIDEAMKQAQARFR